MPERSPTATAQGIGPARIARGASIVSVGMAVPEQVVPNAQVAERLGVDGDWIATRTGVRERRIARPDETLADLAALAGERAIARSGLEPSEIDQVLVATTTPDEVMPNAAPIVAEKLGVADAGSMDIGSACTGFVSALAVATAQLESGRAGNVLVIGADIMSRILNLDDRRTAGLFADGAGAVVVRAVEGQGAIGPFVLGTDGAHCELVRVPREDGYIKMNGHDTFRQAVRRLSESTVAAAEKAGVALGEIDLFVYHQANSRILIAVGEQLGLDPERVIDCVPRFGNTSAATVPIGLSIAEAEGRLWPGARVLLGAFGAGLTWGSVVIEWGGSDA